MDGRGTVSTTFGTFTRGVGGGRVRVDCGLIVGHTSWCSGGWEVSRPVGLVAAVMASLALSVVAAPRASAHAHMVKSSPADHAMLAQSPRVIRAWFSEALAARGSVLRLYDAHQRLLAQGGLDPAFSSHEVLSLTPPRLGPGSYMVAWHSVSSDDQAMTQGYFRFSIGTAMQMPPAQHTAGPMGSMHNMPPSSSAARSGSLPQLRLVAPANHARLHNPVSVVIETPSDISLVTMGPKMMSGPGVHLHIVVDGVVNMPASDQLTPAGAHRYAYELAPLKPGRHTIEVFWADNHTHAIVGGSQQAAVDVF